VIILSIALAVCLAIAANSIAIWSLHKRLKDLEKEREEP